MITFVRELHSVTMTQNSPAIVLGAVAGAIFHMIKKTTLFCHRRGL